MKKLSHIRLFYLMYFANIILILWLSGINYFNILCYLWVRSYILIRRIFIKIKLILSKIFFLVSLSISSIKGNSLFSFIFGKIIFWRILGKKYVIVVCLSIWYFIFLYFTFAIRWHPIVSHWVDWFWMNIRKIIRLLVATHFCISLWKYF